MQQEGVNIAGLAFETCPLWEPSLDGRLISTLMFLPTEDLTWFEQPRICAAKVRKVSRLGRQISKLQAGFELGPACRHGKRLKDPSHRSS
jgi:hypothetical protein